MNYQIRAIVSLGLILLSHQAFALGAKVQVSNLSFRGAGSPHVRLGQMTREMATLPADSILVNYKINGADRVMVDDDGLATLYIYHRTLTGARFNDDITPDSPLPQPLTPLTRSLTLLKSVYEGVKAQDPARISDIIARIDKVKKMLASATKVSDLQTSGLESLINDLMSNHTYTVELGNDKSVRKTLDQLIGQGAPVSLTDQMAARCRDTIDMKWKSATNDFGGKAPSRVDAESRSADPNTAR